MKIIHRKIRLANEEKQISFINIAIEANTRVAQKKLEKTYKVSIFKKGNKRLQNKEAFFHNSWNY